MTLIILGLGPGDVQDITRRAWDALENADRVLLRTEQHPCVPHLPLKHPYRSFDEVYESLEQFEEVYRTITERVIEAAQQHANVVYAVPGDPFIAESTVQQIVARAQSLQLPYQVINGMSFIEPTCAALGVDALQGLQLIDALDVATHHHPPINPQYGALLAQVYSRAVASNVKLTLMNQYPDEFEVTLVHRAGEQTVLERLPLYEIDRSEHISHLTSLYVPALGRYRSFEAFQEIIAHLRAPEGCPWDREQTHASLRPYLMEEAYEVLQTLNDGDTEALSEELGDLLLQIVLHAQIALEDGEFSMADVLENICTKMIRRHPHVWGSTEVDNAEAVVANWEQIKQAEKRAKGNGQDGFVSVLEDVPPSFSALMRAHKYAKRASKLGFDYEKLADTRAKILEELAEIEQTTHDQDRLDEAGDLLFATMDYVRWLGIEPEVALEFANSKFARRFRYVERKVWESGKPMTDYTLAELDQFWREAKRATTPSGDSSE